ncbi:MAG: dihydropteroate synthase, partial [Halarchaeum sp.]
DRWTRALVPKHAARNPGEARALDDAAFENADVADVAGRLFTVPLREAGADAVERRLDALGGTCLTSSVGAPGRLVAAALSGSEAQFRALADGVEDEDVGLGWFADALRAHLDGGARVPDVVGAVRLGGDDALARARRASEAGAATVDLAVEPSWDVETAVERVAPVVEALAADGVDVAVTTRRAPVAAAALDAGATAVRDESGLADPEMRFVVAERDATLALAPVAPAARGPADDVVADARSALAERVLVAERAGISRSRVRVEPRGATAADARALLARAPELHGLGCAVGANADATTAAIAAWQGVDAVRVEAVTDGAEAVRAVAALLDAARR